MFPAVECLLTWTLKYCGQKWFIRHGSLSKVTHNSLRNVLALFQGTNINNHLTLVQTWSQLGNVSIPASKWRRLLQWNVVTPYCCLPYLLFSASVFKIMSLKVSFQAFSLNFVFFFLSFVPALKRLSLGLLFLVTYTLSSLYVTDEYLISDDYMVCIHLAVLGCGRIPLLWGALDLQEWFIYLLTFSFASILKTGCQQLVI